MNKMYNEDEADRLTKEYCELVDFDITNKSRKIIFVLKRVLHYQVLHKLNNMNDQNISDYLASRGVNTNRSSIWQSLSKTDHYYSEFEFFRTIYDSYFKDFKERSNGIKASMDKIALNKVKESVHELINDLSIDEMKDMKEFVELRIKSYVWRFSN